MAAILVSAAAKVAWSTSRIVMVVTETWKTREDGGAFGRREVDVT